LAVAALLAFPIAHANAAPLPLPLLHFVDDQGKTIDKELDVCFQVEFRTDCRQLASGAELQAPPTFYSLRVEGKDHGPTALRREELKPQLDGSFRVTVARKAWLRVESGARQQPLAVSLYTTADRSFREPAFRASLSPGASEVKIPAGEFVASLALKRNAPDLQRLKADPAARVRMSYHAREGWSLVARCRAAATLRPVGRVTVKAAEAFGYGEKDRPIGEALSGTDGLVLLSGLHATMASLSARHPEFITTEVQGLTASPGTFAFREVDLATGGRLAAHVTVHGRPLSGAKCQVYALAPDAPDPKEPYRELWAGNVDPLGICRSERLAQGIYKLRVQIPESTAQVNRWVNVVEAQDSDVDVALAPTRIFGEVRRGGRPAPGYSVEAMLIARDLPKGAKGDISAKAASDDSGRYELTLWIPGWYGFFLHSPSGNTVAGHKDLTTEGDDERKVDFDLQASAFHGTVVNEAGRPVEKAVVTVRWEGLLSATTDDHGSFEVGVQGEGTGTLTAYKNGYRESDPVDIPVAKDAPIPPVNLILHRKEVVTGRVLSAAGSPVAGAAVDVLVSTPESGPVPYRVIRSGSDGTFEVESPPGPPRVFVSGPGCPLSGFDLPTPAPSGGGGAADTGAPAPPPILRCPELPAALELTLVDDRGNPIAHAGAILRREGAIVPQHVLADHLRLLGLPSETDGTGHLILAGLAPGNYELFLNTISSESTIAAGSRQGYLTSVALPALATTELQLTLPGPP
jgi:hypothetical protein